MEELCQGTNGFELQVQQNFMKEWMRDHKDWKKLLVYHGIGSGKTCTGIVMAEEWLREDPTHKVTIILPARLKTNFLDELISPCGADRYISSEDFELYYNQQTPSRVKAKIRKQFIAKIHENYDIMSFEKFRVSAFKALQQNGDLEQWAHELTKNRMVIVDEVHNLINVRYKPSKYKEMVTTKQIPANASGIQTMLFRYLTSHTASNCKMVLMTATPIFDNILQLQELAWMLNPDIPKKDTRNLLSLIEHLRGKVSYFPGTSPNAYPSITYFNHDVPASKTQDDVINMMVRNGSDSDPFDDDDMNNIQKVVDGPFMTIQRQVSISCLPNHRAIDAKSVQQVVDNLPEYAPKVDLMLHLIKKHRGKHLVFSNFIQHGLYVVEAALRKDGWKSIHEVQGNSALMEKHAYKVYAMWDGSSSDKEKQFVKAMANDKENIDGKFIRVMLGSPSIKEGVSFKHIQHLHLVDPVWNQSAKAQVEGRAIRFCSHIDVPEKHPFLKRSVDVHTYKLVPSKVSEYSITADQFLYDKVIPHKLEMVQFAEEALRKVSIDYFLFRKLYEGNHAPSPPPRNFRNSPISLNQDVHIQGFRGVAQQNSCPKPRRPDANGNCPPNMTLQRNNKGDPCCYKDRKKAARGAATEWKGCPKQRRPEDGKCADGYAVKENKHGVQCCFKQRAKKE